MELKTTIQGSPLPEQLVGTNITLLAPGYQGQVTQLESTGGGGRAPGDKMPLAEAASKADVFVVSQFSVDVSALPGSGDSGGRGAAAVPPRLIVPKRDGVEYAVLQTGEDGYSHWVFPEGETPAEAVFPLSLGPKGTSDPAGRGPVTKAMRGIVRVVAWLAKPLLGKGALAIAGAWENSRRPYGMRQLTSDGRYVEPEWPALSTGPVLLLVHGTFSTPDAAFSGWVGTAQFSAIAQRYGNRCLALAHPSLSVAPDMNVEWMLSQLPPTFKDPIDVVCHSRGGLVARELAASDRLKVRRVCQIGAPNNGTPLAEAAQLARFIDGHTALLTELPDSVSTIVLEGILCLVKLLLAGAGDGLPGLSSMEPEGEYLMALGRRRPGAEQWFTVGADFCPAASVSSRLVTRVADKVVDQFFGSPNDLVVPSDGCHLPGPETTDSLRLVGDKAHHCNYFQQAVVQDRLNRWLQ